MAHSSPKACDVLAHLLMTPSPTTEPDQDRHDKKSQKANTLQERGSPVVLETPQAAGKKVDTAGPLPSVVHETPYTDVATAEFHPDAFQAALMTAITIIIWT